MADRWGWLGRANFWTLAFVVLGLALRGFHYLRDPSVWMDEAALLVNVLSHDFADFLGPLHLLQAAPPLFLWAERAVVLALGDTSYAFRLIPFLASCLALLLLVPLARRLLPSAAVPWAILLFACSDRLLWHACEAKPYALDVFCALGLVGVFFWTERRPLLRLMLYAVLAPLCAFASYPTCFVYGGILVALLPSVWRERRPSHCFAFVAIAAAIGGSFLLLAGGPIQAQRSEELTGFWTRHFANWDRPWTIPIWSFFSTLEVFRYCCMPLGQLLTVPAVVGGFVLWRRQERSALVLLAAPILLAWLAAVLGKYPYGGMRLMVFSAAAITLLIAAGLPPTLHWLRDRWRPGAALLLLLVLAPLGLTLNRVVAPWPRADTAAAAAFVLEQRQPDEPVFSNTWDSIYLFRQIGASFRFPSQSLADAGGTLIGLGPTNYDYRLLPGPPGRRFWYVWVDLSSSGSQATTAVLQQFSQWRLIQCWQVPFIWVLYLEREAEKAVRLESAQYE